MKSPGKLAVCGLLSIFCLPTFMPSVLANPTPIGSSGRELRPFKVESAPDVSITEEKLIIKDAIEGRVPSFSGTGEMLLPCVGYRAVYRFENRSKGKRTFKIGFPVVAYSHKCSGTSIGGIVSMKASYGGKSLKVEEVCTPAPCLYPRDELGGIVESLLKARLAEVVPETPEFVDLSKLGKDEEQARACLERSDLPAVTIERLKKVLRDKVFGDDDFVIASQELIWYSFNLELPPGLSEPLEVSYSSFLPPWEEKYTISYILRTGKSWGRSVGNLTVEFLPEGQFMSAGGRYQFSPQKRFNLTRDASKYELRRENERLTYNIRIKRIVPENFKRDKLTSRNWGSVDTGGLGKVPVGSQAPAAKSWDRYAEIRASIDQAKQEERLSSSQAAEMEAELARVLSMKEQLKERNVREFTPQDKDVLKSEYDKLSKKLHSYLN